MTFSSLQPGSQALSVLGWQTSYFHSTMPMRCCSARNWPSHGKCCIVWDLTLACQGPLQHSLHVPKACLQIPVHDAHCCQRKGCNSYSQIQPLVVWLVQLTFESATLQANKIAINRLDFREGPVWGTMVVQQ